MKTTEILFIIDGSGSMGPLTSDTIGGFNSLIEKQKKDFIDDKVLVTTVIFNHSLKTIHDRTDIKSVPLLTNKDYVASGSTALYDAVGMSVNKISDIHRYIRPEDVPDKTLVIINTDGYENSSHLFNSEMVKKLINEKKDKGWEFLFLGANIDASEVGKDIGIEKDYCSNFTADNVGVNEMYSCFSDTISYVRKCDKKIRPDWKDKLNKDSKK